MPEFDCVACGGAMRAGESDASVRCSSCGTRYVPDDADGWNQPEIASSPALSDAEISDAAVDEVTTAGSDRATIGDQASTRPERVHCPECGQQFRDQEGAYAQDFLVDHLEDAHGAFSWVTNGRPIDA